MAELDIKKEIGKRIHAARKSQGLTLVALGELAGNMKQTRLTNWERGTRTPGPEEIKQLAKALDVSPAYLMCLSDEPQDKTANCFSRLLPLLDTHQAASAQNFISAVTDQETADTIQFLSVSTALLPTLSNASFALTMTDESMMPEIRINDVLIIDPLTSPKPGSYVVVKMANKAEVIVCQYKKLSYTAPEFELITLNDNWPNITVTDDIKIDVVGSVIQYIRTY